MADSPTRLPAVKGRSSASTPASRPFQCKWPEGCFKSFNRKSDLQRHYRIHTNERPYACDYKPCEKTFIQRSALTVHRRTHTGDKPHKCPFMSCGKCFSDSSSLARHRRIHTNDKPYICRNQQCGKAFCRKTTMTKHFRKEHPDEALDHMDDDIAYSDFEPSDDEPSLERDSEASCEQDSFADCEIKMEPPQAHGSNSYSPSLWALPGQIIQHPANHSRAQQLNSSVEFKHEMSPRSAHLEHSISSNPQRTLSDPSAISHAPTGFMFTRSNTLPQQITIPSYFPPAMTTAGATPGYAPDDPQTGLWHPAHTLQESPTSMTQSSPGLDQSFLSDSYQLQDIKTAPAVSSDYMQQSGIGFQEPNLQAIRDIILDEPQQQQINHLTQHQQSCYTRMPHATHPAQYDTMTHEPLQQQQYHGLTSQPYCASLPSTPTSMQQLHGAIPCVSPLYQEPLFLPQSSPIGQYFPPTHDNPYLSKWDMFKDGDYQLPNQVIPRFGR